MEKSDLLALISNDCCMVRHYERGNRTSIGKLQRAQAILKLGVTLRYVLEHCDDDEATLATLVDGLRPRQNAAF
jgi:hypothetical protein